MELFDAPIISGIILNGSIISFRKNALEAKEFWGYVGDHNLCDYHVILS